MTIHDPVDFVRDTIYGWIGNLMRDLDAQGIELTVDEVAEAVGYIYDDLTVEPKDYDDLVKPWYDE